MFNNALVSVSNKQGIEGFISQLSKKGMRVVSTGGTASALEKAGVSVVPVSEQISFPEVMNGRVKTLHPNIHMCLLAREGNTEDDQVLKEYSLSKIDLVVGNLYPFEQALEKSLPLQEQVEFIDIGGPSFLRAAAKNFERITVVCDPNDYSWILEKQELTLEDRKYLAAKVFAHTAKYDSMIANYLSEDLVSREEWSMGGQKVKDLRYGENPQQKSTWYSFGKRGIQQAKILQGKELSYNNLLDLDAAVSTLRDFSGFDGVNTCVSLKHNNPCGLFSSNNCKPHEVVKNSLAADPVSVFGGIIAANFEINKLCAEELSQIFLECIVAPKFSTEALEVLGEKKNLRLLEWPELTVDTEKIITKTIAGGFLVQEKDKLPQHWDSSWQVIGGELDESLKSDLLLAWKVCAHLKSNAIAIAAQSQTLGLGMGQVNRVDAVEQAIHRAKKFHSNKSGWVLASDAFFPFPDSIDKAADAGIKWVIQPGGSVKDQEVLDRAKDRGVGLVLTGRRHFLH